MSTITTRSGKGSPLTNNEVDANFTNLNTDKAELSGAAFTGAITTNSTFDGRDVATDGTKLDGIEANADVTDATNVTAAGALMDGELTAIASVKALNQGVATTDSPTFSNLTLSGTDSVKVPSGTTGQRNGSPANGMFRYNSTTAEFEGYQDGAWGSIGGGSADITLNQFTGDGSDTTFTLSGLAAENNTFVYIDGVYQSKDNYTVSTADPAVLTFSTAPPNTTAIEVMSAAISVSNIGTPSDDTVSTAKIVDGAVTTAKLASTLSIQDLTLTGTGAVKMPTGTTAQRPTGVAGQLRYNSTTGGFEGYATEWDSIGGVGDEYISATPTLTTASSAATGSTITVTNHSVYNNPTYTVKQGNTARTFTQVAGVLTITNVTVAETATLTVTVAESGAGKLFASASISVQLVLPAYRYWKLSGMVRSTYSGNYTWVMVNRFNVYSIPNGNGATDNTGTGALGTTSNISGPTFYTGTGPTNLFSTSIYDGWFLYDRSASQILTDAVTYDLGAPTAVASIYYRNRVGQDCSQVVISKSTDNTNWIVAATLSNLGAGEGRSVNV
jgi:hypothetical protein